MVGTGLIGDARVVDVVACSRHGGAGRVVRMVPRPAEEATMDATDTLRWHENGVPHAVHQAHVVAVAGGGVGQDQAWCGGRWPASLLAEMAEADGG
jgi:hypothetical protein